MNTLLHPARRRGVRSIATICACVRASVCSNGAILEGRMNDDAPTVKVHPVPGTQSPYYPRTHWSIVFAAGKDSSADARKAFGELYVAYSRPLLAYLHRLGHSRDSASDLLHGFFEHLLENNGLSTVEKKGNFRHWLRRSLTNFIRDQWDKQRALKRGGGKTHLSVGPDFEAGEVDPTDTGLSPERAYDRKWAIALLKRVLAKLAAEYVQNGKERLFLELKDFLPGGHAASNYEELGPRLNLQANSVAVAVKRLRAGYAELLHLEISNTVEPDMVEEEWRHLRDALGGPAETSTGESKA